MGLSTYAASGYHLIHPLFCERLRFALRTTESRFVVIVVSAKPGLMQLIVS